MKTVQEKDHKLPGVRGEKATAAVVVVLRVRRPYKHLHLRLQILRYHTYPFLKLKVPKPNLAADSNTFSELTLNLDQSIKVAANHPDPAS